MTDSQRIALNPLHLSSDGQSQGLNIAEDFPQLSWAFSMRMHGGKWASFPRGLPEAGRDILSSPAQFRLSEQAWNDPVAFSCLRS